MYNAGAVALLGHVDIELSYRRRDAIKPNLNIPAPLQQFLQTTGNREEIQPVTCSDYDGRERNVRDTVKLFDSLGFTVQLEKSSFVPQHRITFMAFIIDLITMTVDPTSEKIETLIHTCQGLLECPHPTIKEKWHPPLGCSYHIFQDMEKTEALCLKKG